MQYCKLPSDKDNQRVYAGSRLRSKVNRNRVNRNSICGMLKKMSGIRNPEEKACFMRTVCAMVKGCSTNVCALSVCVLSMKYLICLSTKCVSVFYHCKSNHSYEAKHVLVFKARYLRMFL